MRPGPEVSSRFAVRLTAAAANTGVRRSIPPERPHFRLNRTIFLSVIFPVLLVAAVAGIAAIAIFYFCGTRTQSSLIFLLECLSAATLIVLIVWHPTKALFKPLDLKLVRFYGRISYSFYLLHTLGISFAFRIFDPLALNAFGVPLSITTVFATLLSILLTTPAAYFAWRFVESPAIAIGASFGRVQTIVSVR